MLHLRIVAPRERAERVLALLEETPSVHNIVRFPEAARRCVRRIAAVQVDGTHT